MYNTRMITDIDYLHEVIEGKHHGRAIGRTFAKCHEVLGFVHLESPYIFCMITQQVDTLYLMPMLEQIFDQHGLKIKVYDKKECWFHIDNSYIRFIPERDWDIKTRGFRGAEVLMRHWD